MRSDPLFAAVKSQEVDLTPGRHRLNVAVCGHNPWLKAETSIFDIKTALRASFPIEDNLFAAKNSYFQKKTQLPTSKP